MSKLFGFSIEDDDKKSPSIVSPVVPNNEDGVDHYLTSGFFGSYVDIEGVYKSEFELIKRYREMALHPEVDSAIEDIVNEAIVSDSNDVPVQIELSNLNASDGIKKKIRDEFKYILDLLDFNKKSHEIYRNWYIDGRLYYHKIIDLKKPQDGIKELRYIDAMKMKYVRQEKKKDNNGNGAFIKKINNDPMDYEFPEIEEYFIYNPKMSYPTSPMTGKSSSVTSGGIKMAKDAITYCTSGLVDRNKSITLSYLNKAIKSLNQLRMIEDSLVIYRLCLIGDSRVKTENGYSYIKDINVGDVVYAYDNRVDVLVKTSVTNKWITGTKKTYTVKSKHHSITGTDTHPVLVYDSNTKEVKYVPIKDLIPKVHSLTYIKPESTNDIVLFNDVREKAYSIVDTQFWSTFKLEGKEKFIETLSEKTGVKELRIRNFLYGLQHLEESSLVKLKEEFKELNDIEYNEKHEGFCNNELSLPEYVTPEFARLFGFLLGDGSVSKYRVVFAEGEDEEQNLYYANLMRTFFGNCTKYDSKNRKYTNYITSNTLAAELLISFGYIPGAKNKRIPSWVFNASDEIKRQLVFGLLDADGHYRDLVNGFSCEISLCNKQLIEDIKELWTSIGLCSGQIRHRIREEQMRIVGEEKEPRLMPRTECYELYLSEYELPKFEKIMSVEYHSEEEVYDIEVEHEKHNFVANGIVVHNSRAPERRIFYIDVGNLPKVKAEQYLRDVMMRYRNKLVYDASTGEIRDDKKFMSMLEDFWLPRREGGRGTEISTLPGGQNLGEITDIEYFKKKLYRSLNVPPSRMDGEGGFNLGRSSEILRDELKFTKFVSRLRKRFSQMFNDMLKTQLILKNIITPEDWDLMQQHIQYDFLYDNHFSELKEAELLSERLNLVATAEPYVGKYYSQDYVRRNILRQTDQEIIEQDEIIKKEIEDGVIPDPTAMVDPETGQPITDDNIRGQSGNVPIEPEIDGSATEAPEGGEI